MSNFFAFYRLPDSETYVKVSGNIARIIDNYNIIGIESGVVIAPFVNTSVTPIVLIPFEGNEVTTAKSPAIDGKMHVRSIPEEGFSCTDSYAESFRKVHSVIANGECSKIVLSRRKVLLTEGSNVEELFFEACRMYPHLMVELFSTPMTGTWIVATPEILVQGTEDGYHTMALAGTMNGTLAEPHWSDKNRNEQHLVEKYVENAISPFSDKMEKDGPYTVQAGNLMHLRTDFSFQMKEGKTVGDIVDSLHPTPAVCGFPTEKAMNCLLEYEPHDRRYYSGFAGPVNAGGETHLYVSLRCAEITPDEAGNKCELTLYAGGGIMPESTCTAEFDETEDKMQTIIRLLK